MQRATLGRQDPGPEVQTQQHQAQAQTQAQTNKAPPGRNPETNVLQQLNLRAVRMRVQELQATISRMLAVFQNQYEPKWTEVLGQYAVVNSQMFGLMEDLKPILRMFVAHPVQITGDNATILPIMLSSKLLPEMEKRDEGLKEERMGGLQGANSPAVQIELQRQVEAVKQACDLAEKVITEARSLYGITGRQAPQSHGNPVDKAQLARLAEQERQLRLAASSGEGLRLPQGQQHRPDKLPHHLAHLSPLGTLGSQAQSPANDIVGGGGLQKTSQVYTPGGITASSPGFHHASAPVSSGMPLSNARTASTSRPPTPPLHPTGGHLNAAQRSNSIPLAAGQSMYSVGSPLQARSPPVAPLGMNAPSPPNLQQQAAAQQQQQLNQRRLMALQQQQQQQLRRSSPFNS